MPEWEMKRGRGGVFWGPLHVSLRPGFTFDICSRFPMWISTHIPSHGSALSHTRAHTHARTDTQHVTWLHPWGDILCLEVYRTTNHNLPRLREQYNWHPAVSKYHSLHQHYICLSLGAFAQQTLVLSLFGGEGRRRVYAMCFILDHRTTRSEPPALETRAAIS